MTVEDGLAKMGLDITTSESVAVTPTQLGRIGPGRRNVAVAAPIPFRVPTKPVHSGSLLADAAMTKSVIGSGLIGTSTPPTVTPGRLPERLTATTYGRPAK